MPAELLRRLDIEVAIYPDRVQAIDRHTGAFVDFPADRPFSTPGRLIDDGTRFEDALYKAVRPLLRGGHLLLDAKACLASGQAPFSLGERAMLERALRNTGFSEILLDDAGGCPE